MEKDVALKFDLSISYGKDKEGQLNISISASSTTSGFTSGTTWTPIFVAIDKTVDNHKFSYFVGGVLKWKLLGATIYTQAKEYKGTVSL